MVEVLCIRRPYGGNAATGVQVHNSPHIGGWCNGSIAVSKTVGEGSNPSPPASKTSYGRIAV